MAGPDCAKSFRGSNYFWSDQYGVRIQSVGSVSEGAVQVVAGSVKDRKFLACYREGDRLAGAFAMNSPRLIMQAKLLFERNVAWDTALAELRT